ncbi:hypothetical protein D6827_03880, partial [Candidatus Parcubacteria bacterium]
MISEFINYITVSLAPIPATVVLAALPFTELRLALPVAISFFQLSFWQAYFWSVFGNLLPFFPLFFGLRIGRKVAALHWRWLREKID